MSKKIFIIDDDDFLLDMYGEKFRESGFEVETAGSGTEALEKVKNGTTADVVLLDIVMPGMDGFAFLKQVRKENLLANALIVILSNLGQKEDVQRGQAFGVANYIIKAHHTPSEVVAKIKQIIEK